MRINRNRVKTPQPAKSALTPPRTINREGSRHYKSYVGPADKFELQGEMQFDILKLSGMQPSSFVADIGCGSLRGGRKVIPFLESNHYFGIEPNFWLVEEGIKNVIGNNTNKLKTPQFNKSSNFELSLFNQRFDFIIAQSIFSHASKKQIRTCLEEVKNTLSDDGVFLATFKVGAKDYLGEQWVYPGVVFFTEETIMRLIAESGLIGKKCDYEHVNFQTWYVISLPNNTNKVENISKLKSTI